MENQRQRLEELDGELTSGMSSVIIMKPAALALEDAMVSLKMPSFLSLKCIRYHTSYVGMVQVQNGILYIRYRGR